jgi:hypothetical protein
MLLGLVIGAVDVLLMLPCRFQIVAHPSLVSSARALRLASWPRPDASLCHLSSQASSSSGF